MEIGIEERYANAHIPKCVPFDIKVDVEKCTKCKRCVLNCPGGIYWDEEKEMPRLGGYGLMEKVSLACNACLAACPSGALEYVGEYRVLEGRYKTTLQDVGLVPPNPFGDETPRPYDEIEEKLTDVEKVIYTRRANRIYQNKPLPKELINRILEAGRFAPSSGNGQPWKFIVVTDKNLIKEIDTECIKFLSIFRWLYLGSRGISGKDTPWRKALVPLLSYTMPGDMDQRPMGALGKAIDLYKETGDLHFDAPCVIYILNDVRGIASPELDTGICAQNMVLAAHALGLGTCYVGFGTVPFEFLSGLNKKLGIEYPWRMSTSIAVGYPKGKIDKAVPRGVPPVKWIE